MIKSIFRRCARALVSITAWALFKRLFVGFGTPLNKTITTKQRGVLWQQQ